MKIFYTVLKGGTTSRRDKVEHRAMTVASLLEQLGHDSRLPVASDSMGRPHFPSSSHLDLSISHAAPFTAYAVGEGRVGIDLEQVSRVPHATRIAARFFTPAEREQVKCAEDERAAVCLIWTQKEALAKYLGHGLAATYRTCTVNPPKGICFHSQTLTLEGQDYILSICTDAGTDVIRAEVPVAQDPLLI